MTINWLALLQLYRAALALKPLEDLIVMVVASEASSDAEELLSVSPKATVKSHAPVLASTQGVDLKLRQNLQATATNQMPA